MGQPLFGIDVDAIVTQNIAPGMPDATLTKYTQGSYDVTNPAGGISKTPTNYPCKGLVSRLDAGHYTDDLVRNLTGEVTIFLGTLPDGVVPEVGDAITITPPGFTSSRVFVISDHEGKRTVEVDPAGATAVCQVDGSP